RNEGMVNVGKSHDTSKFAVESIRQWWLLMGRERYPDAEG
ncbi:Transposase, Rhodopirellula-type, partial [mine drainage metagenome]